MADSYRDAGMVDEAARDSAIARQEADCAAGIWRTREGQPVHISAMSEGHLRNALAMLRRNGFIGPRTLSFYLRGPKPRGDMAMEAYSGELLDLAERPVNPYVDLLEDEMKRRGLPA